MKKIIGVVILSFITLNSYADSFPNVVILGAPSCALNTGDEIGGCFKNSTGQDIPGGSKLSVQEKATYSSGGIEVQRAGGLGLSHNQFVIVSANKRTFTTNNVKKVEISLVDDVTFAPVSGCQIQIDANSTGKPIFNIKKEGSQYYCSP